MPNLKQILSLKQEYYQLNNQEEKALRYLNQIEAKDTLIKAFNSANINERASERRLFSFINESLNLNEPSLIKYFEDSKEEDVVLLFIDIISFSKTIKGWSNTDIKDFLDNYYKSIIPIIYKHEGEIEKLMGDGIICVFGPPFLNTKSPEYVYNAERCAEEVIKLFYGKDKNVKVAIHKGKVNYYKVPSEHYGEYTMIGQPVTDLYRLESISKPNAINFFSKSSYDNLGWKYSIIDTSDIQFYQEKISPLQGVEFNEIKYIKFIDYI